MKHRFSAALAAAVWLFAASAVADGLKAVGPETESVSRTWAETAPNGRRCWMAWKKGKPMRISSSRQN